VIVLGVALAGALGAPARYAVEQVVRRVRPTSFPLGTFVVNVSGSFALGVVVGLALAQGLDPDVRTVVGTGFLGAYTTFSTYAYETVRRAEERQRRTALLYALGSIAAAGLASALGLGVTGAL
jgi:fluoride exporter